MTKIEYFFFSSRRRHTRCLSDWSSDVCSSDLRLLDAIGDEGRDRGTGAGQAAEQEARDRKSTRLNSSHLGISYAVFCLKKKTFAFITLGPALEFLIPFITDVDVAHSS